MGLPSFDELSNKAYISYGLMVAIAIVAFYLGTVYSAGRHFQVTAEHDHDAMYREMEQTKQFLLDEVGGLRSDWERQNRIVEKQIDELKDECSR